VKGKHVDIAVSLTFTEANLNSSKLKTFETTYNFALRKTVAAVIFLPSLLL